MEIKLSELDCNDNYYQYFTLLKQLTTIDPDTISKEDFVEHLELIHSNPLHKIIIAKYGENIIGTSTILFEPKFIHNISYIAHIEDVVVDSKYRNLCVGKRLIEKIIEICKTFMDSRGRKCYKIILDSSQSCIEFYKGCGFKVKEQQMALYFD